MSILSSSPNGYALDVCTDALCYRNCAVTVERVSPALPRRSSDTVLRLRSAKVPVPDRAALLGRRAITTGRCMQLAADALGKGPGRRHPPE